MELLGLSWLVLVLDGSPLTLGAVMFCRGIPGLVVAPIGGVLADRLQRRGLVVTTQLGVGGLTLGIAELSHSGDIKIVHLVLYALLVGGLMVLNTPAVQALTYDSAGQDDLANAVILTQVAFGISRVLGPILGGLLIVSGGMNGCFALSGASNLVAGIVLLAWKGHPRGVAVFSSFSFQLSEGIHFLGANRLVLVLLVIEIVMELFALPYYTLMPLLARPGSADDCPGGSADDGCCRGANCRTGCQADRCPGIRAHHRAGRRNPDASAGRHDVDSATPAGAAHPRRHPAGTLENDPGARHCYRAVRGADRPQRNPGAARGGVRPGCPGAG